MEDGDWVIGKCRATGAAAAFSRAGGVESMKSGRELDGNM
jgi:hypothetical protein